MLFEELYYFSEVQKHCPPLRQVLSLESLELLVFNQEVVPDSEQEGGHFRGRRWLRRELFLETSVNLQKGEVLVGWLRILLGQLELNKILDTELLRGKVGEEQVAAAVKL